MIAYRLRRFGDPNWTEVLLEGDLEEFAGAALISCLAEVEGLHVQERDEDGTWVDI